MYYPQLMRLLVTSGIPRPYPYVWLRISPSSEPLPVNVYHPPRIVDHLSIHTWHYCLSFHILCVSLVSQPLFVFKLIIHDLACIVCQASFTMYG